MKSLPLAQCTQKFIEEMEAGLRKEPSSLAMIPAYLSPIKEWPINISLTAIDMGGTNFRIANVFFDENGKADIRDFIKEPMPGSGSKVDADEFFSYIAEKLLPYKSDTAGLCFSYPADILPDGDGRIRFFTKEIEIINAEGKRLGEGINKALVKLGGNPKRFSVLNDTVAALLGTRDANIGMILGTGLNTCYDEKGMIINMESGGYTGFPAESYDFGPLAEMKVSGAYILDLLKKKEVNEDEIYDRAGRIVCCILSGIIKHAGFETAKIAVEGSAYYNNERLRGCIHKYMKDFAAGELGLTYEFLDGKDKTLIGAAIAAITELKTGKL